MRDGRVGDNSMAGPPGSHIYIYTYTYDICVFLKRKISSTTRITPISWQVRCGVRCGDDSNDMAMSQNSWYPFVHLHKFLGFVHQKYPQIWKTIDPRINDHWYMSFCQVLQYMDKNAFLGQHDFDLGDHRSVTQFQPIAI